MNKNSFAKIFFFKAGFQPISISLEEGLLIKCILGYPETSFKSPGKGLLKNGPQLTLDAKNLEGTRTEGKVRAERWQNPVPG